MALEARALRRWVALVENMVAVEAGAVPQAAELLVLAALALKASSSSSICRTSRQPSSRRPALALTPSRLIGTRTVIKLNVLALVVAELQVFQALLAEVAVRADHTQNRRMYF